MKLALLPSIFYECVIERSNGISTSKFYTYRSFLRSRELCIASFLEYLMLDDNQEYHNVFLRVLVRHLSTGMCFEILNNTTYEYGSADLQMLAQEYALYQREGVHANAVIYYNQYHLISIPGTQSRKMHVHPEGSSVVFLEQDYWLFTKARKQGKQLA